MLLTAQSRQKLYIDKRRRPLEFQIDDWLFLKVTLMKCVIRFGKKNKLSLSYVGPYRIIWKRGEVAYELDLPSDLKAVHPVLYVSMLHKCVSDPSGIFSMDNI